VLEAKRQCRRSFGTRGDRNMTLKHVRVGCIQDTLGAVRVKGKTDPQAVFAVLGAHQRRALRLYPPIQCFRCLHASESC
jgi:hypothetical protein